jgi:hypothetical protein
VRERYQLLAIKQLGGSVVSDDDRSVSALLAPLFYIQQSCVAFICALLLEACEVNNYNECCVHQQRRILQNSQFVLDRKQN